MPRIIAFGVGKRITRAGEPMFPNFVAGLSCAADELFTNEEIFASNRCFAVSTRWPVATRSDVRVSLLKSWARFLEDRRNRRGEGIRGRGRKKSEGRGMSWLYIESRGYLIDWYDCSCLEDSRACSGGSVVHVDPLDRSSKRLNIIRIPGGTW